jgi:phage N-6-adenine-methyltransferase
VNEATRKAMFSSQTGLWSTPQDFFDRLNREFHFTLDPCTDGTNAKCPHYFTEADDGLAQTWAPHVVFMNPPYSQIAAWIRKAYEEAQAGATVVALIPSRTDTRYWHDYVMKADEIRFVKGRLKFGEGRNSAPFPSAVVVFRKTDRPTPKISAMNAKEATDNGRS